VEANAVGRIRVFQATDGRGVFVDEEMRLFVPRGANYVRLRNGWHSTFDVGHYDQAAADVAPTAVKGRETPLIRI
jgi:hypothetical protein